LAALSCDRERDRGERNKKDFTLPGIDAYLAAYSMQLGVIDDIEYVKWMVE